MGLEQGLSKCPIQIASHLLLLPHGHVPGTLPFFKHSDCSSHAFPSFPLFPPSLPPSQASCLAQPGFASREGPQCLVWPDELGCPAGFQPWGVGPGDLGQQSHLNEVPFCWPRLRLTPALPPQWAPTSAASTTEAAAACAWPPPGAVSVPVPRTRSWEWTLSPARVGLPEGLAPAGAPPSRRGGRECGVCSSVRWGLRPVVVCSGASARGHKCFWKLLGLWGSHVGSMGMQDCPHCPVPLHFSQSLD